MSLPVLPDVSSAFPLKKVFLMNALHACTPCIYSCIPGDLLRSEDKSPCRSLGDMKYRMAAGPRLCKSGKSSKLWSRFSSPVLSPPLLQPPLSLLETVSYLLQAGLGLTHQLRMVLNSPILLPLGLPVGHQHAPAIWTW